MGRKLRIFSRVAKVRSDGFEGGRLRLFKKDTLSVDSLSAHLKTKYTPDTIIISDVVAKISETTEVLSEPNPPLVSKRLKGKPGFEAINNGLNILKLGYYENEEGDTIKTLQNILIELGYKIDGDKPGQFMYGTEKALIEYQRDRGFKEEADGVFGKETIRVLDFELYNLETEIADVALESEEAFVFRIPIDKSHLNISELEFSILAYGFIFGITKEQYLALRNSPEEWATENYRPITKEDVARGYLEYHFKVASYKRLSGDEVYSGMQVVYASNAEEDKWSDARSAKEKLDQVSLDTYLRFQINEQDPEVLEELNEAGFDSIQSFKDGLEQFEQEFEWLAVSNVYEFLKQSYKTITIENIRYKTLGNVEALLERLKLFSPIFEEFDNKAWEAIQAFKEYCRNKGFVESQINQIRFAITDKCKVLGDITPTLIQSFEFDEIREIYVVMGYQVQKILQNEFAPADKEITDKEAPVKKILTAISELEIKVSQVIDNNVNDFPILADPKFLGGLRKTLNSVNAESLQKELTDTTADKLKAIKELGFLFRDPDNYERIWELAPIILITQMQLGVDQKTIAGDLIQKKIEAYKYAQLWKSLGLAALGIAIGIASFFTTGLAAVGLALLGVGVSGVDLYIEFKNYTFRKAASNVSIDPEEGLGIEDPGLTALVFASVGLVFDLAAVLSTVKALKVIKPGLSLSQESEEGLEEVLDLLVEGFIKDKKLSPEKALGFKKNIQKVWKLGLAKFSPEEIIALTEKFSKLSDELTDSLIELNDLFKLAKMPEEDMHSIWRLYLADHSKYIEDVPDLLRIIKEGAFEDPALLKEIFNHHTIQRIMLGYEDNASLISDFWVKFNNPLYKSKRKSQTFLEYLSSNTFGLLKRIKTGADKTRTPLSKLAVNFDNYSDFAKNVTVLNNTEPELSKVITTFGLSPKASFLSPRLGRKLMALLDSNLIGSAESVEKARENIMKAINKMLGENALDIQEFKHLMKAVKSATSRGSIGEYFVGAKNYFRSTLTIRKPFIKLDGIPGFIKKTRQPDFFTNPPPKTLDVKVGYEDMNIDLDQAKDYFKLVDESKIAGSATQKALSDAKIPNGVLDKHNYLFLPGPGGNAYKAAKRAYDFLLDNDLLEHIDVFYIDAKGNLIKYLPGNNY